MTYSPSYSSQSFNSSISDKAKVKSENENSVDKKDSFQLQIPQITLPKGGGALKSIDEKFTVNPVNGAASFSIPLPLTPGRNGFTPALALNYNSGTGNSLFGLGWGVDILSIQRKTDKQLPRYIDDVENEDVFMFSGVEDLVPVLDKDNSWTPVEKTIGNYKVKQYRPRIEGEFSLIERISPAGKNWFYWKVTSKENVVSFFGINETHRIADPADATKIFKWLPEISFDDKGNLIQFFFKEENLDNVEHELHEANRFKKLSSVVNKHLKRVQYGNRKPFYPGYTTNPDNIDEIYNPLVSSPQEYFFELVFDYGEHADNLPSEALFWQSRPDAFSDYRAGFEIRTYRLCERILMFHNFQELQDEYGAKTCLVKSLDFIYKQQSLISKQQLEVTYLKSIIQKGYLRDNVSGKYDSRSFPAMDFEYNELNWNTEVKTISPENIVNAPEGLSANYRWVDLYNEGIPGILTEQADAWYYKSNLGNGKFTPAGVVTPKPSFTGITNGNLQLQDIEANGKKHAVLNTPGLNGYFELSDDNEWQPFRTFTKMPDIDLRKPNVKFIDLNGDGMPDLIISEESVFVWYPARGIDGYEAAEFTAKSYDEEKGPAVVFADNTQSIFLADMSGDGMTDIVRIRNAEVCYWPNLGYGKFGTKVNMSNAPVFDQQDFFNPAYIHLADISGTGATDIIYLGKNRFSAWLNLSGNAWSKTCKIDPFPETSSPNQLAVTDLLGTGTACIVWSSPLPSYANAPMLYIDLMGGRKPHIMSRHVNNMGKETIVEYKSSSQFYLDDKKAGKAWITKLPFPVHCVSKLEIIDKITDIRFSNKYTYHHGYYDHEEREFRGFGMVEQIDTEEYEYLKNLNAANAIGIQFHEPPVLTRTWFHTGAYLRNQTILDHFKHEYWYNNPLLEPAFSAAGILNPEKIEWQLPDAKFEGNISSVEIAEAYRACKGMVLRQEIFALDGTDKEGIPYSASTHNCHIKLLQPKLKNRHAVYIVQESEAITFSYERNIVDPRVAHTLNLEVDAFGNVLKSVAVAYPRLNAAITETVTNMDVTLQSYMAVFKEAQGKEHIVYTETQVSKDVKEKTGIKDLVYYQLPKPWSVKTFEAAGVQKTNEFYVLSNFKNILSGTNIDVIEYHEKLNPTLGIIQLRTIEEVRTLFLAYDLEKPLKAGTHGALGLIYEAYQLAYTPALLDVLFNKDDAGNPLITARVSNADMLEGKFTHIDPADVNWWIRSGTVQYFDQAAGENRDNSALRFYQPVSFTDPFDSVTNVNYYKDYFLLIQQTKDALQNISSVESFDFRTLSPKRLKDINSNIAEVAIDMLGLVAGTAVLGKGAEADDLINFNSNLSAQQVKDFFSDPFTFGRNLLQHATTRLLYDFSKTPCVVASIKREEHHKINANPRLQYSFEYSGGMGNLVLKKIQAEAGDAPFRGPDGKLVKLPNGELDLKPAIHRWIGNGRTILNNKGKPVRQYEPYFSDSHLYEIEPELRESGVSPVFHYDSAGRLVETLMPDETFSSVEYSAWMQKSFDQNDNCKKSKWYTDRINRLIDAALIKKGKDPVKEKEVAEKTAFHDNTPAEVHSDSLGRPFFDIGHNKIIDAVTNAVTNEFQVTRTILDIEGNVREFIDARGNRVMKYGYNMLGHRVYQSSMDGGQRWTLNNVVSSPVKTWDERNHEFQYTYDVLHRPLSKKVLGGDSLLPLNNVIEKIIYGEGMVNDQAMNVRGKPVFVYDTAGKVYSPSFDFKGNPTKSERRFAVRYKEVVNWSGANPDAELEADVFTNISTFDALNRIVSQTASDGSIFLPEYNEASLPDKIQVSQNGITDLFVKNIDYNEKGQRSRIIYGNDVSTNYHYDKHNFRLIRLETKRQNNELLQDWHYTFDPVGNITHLEDKNIPDVFFRNDVIKGTSIYTYDPLYRLTEATGREHLAQAGFGLSDNWNDLSYLKKYSQSESMAWHNYTQKYSYDAAGNIRRMTHTTPDTFANWIRDYQCEVKNNRLLSSNIATNAANFTPYKYEHHLKHGFITSMPHLQVMQWNFREELQAVAQQRVVNGTPETTYYVYDGSGQRVRKVTEWQAGPGVANPPKKSQRLYLGAVEIYNKYNSGGSSVLKRISYQVMDDKKKIAMIETRTEGMDEAPARLVRYQFSNHLGSSSLETDQTGKVISYEEYHPYGTTSYQAMDKDTKATAKRYRYTGMERDEESGLEYHSARYYVPWLGRWLSCDPIGIVDGLNFYRYTRDNPVILVDPAGTDPCDPTKTSCYVNPKNSPKEINMSGGALGWIDEKGKVRLFSEPIPFVPSFEPSPTKPKPDKSPNDFMQGLVTGTFGSIERKITDIPAALANKAKDMAENPARALFQASPIIMGVNLAKGVGEDISVLQDESVKAVEEPDDVKAGSHAANVFGAVVSIGMAVVLPEEGAAESGLAGVTRREVQAARGATGKVDIALGQMEPNLGPRLEDFARDRNALMFDKWHEAGLTDLPVAAAARRETFPAYFNDALRDPSKIGTIHFHLGDIANVETILSNLRSADKAPWTYKQMTKTELMTILQNPSLFDRLVLWKGSQQVWPPRAPRR